ncbi:hypothetical protein [Parvibaculum sp.]|uniref:hypothetical protein n=1 Tax=Parvibaculum sp. TaxID=2024848 RepID=UPI00320FDD7B
MEEDSDDEASATFEREETAPTSIPVSIRGAPDDDRARAEKFAHRLAAIVRVISKYLNLQTLDGITVATDYATALRELDRGYETSYVLTPSEDFGSGVAMTPSVIRDGLLRSHIVLSADLMWPLGDETHEGFELAIHLLFHECAHVHITAAYDKAFPNVLLRKALHVHENLRSQVILACWDEYAATCLSAGCGKELTKDYEEIFLKALAECRNQADACIASFRLHRNHSQVLHEVYGLYGCLMKYACYHAGNMRGLGLGLDDLPQTKAALTNHWFSPWFKALSEACEDLAEQFGSWTDHTLFERIGGLADQIVAEGGITITDLSDGGANIKVRLW